jgi:protein-tyrosine phosphatase
MQKEKNSIKSGNNYTHLYKNKQLEASNKPGATSRNYLLSLPTMKILMVCLGNICRSPLAEGILQHKAAQAGLAWTIDSAGTNGYHVGEAPHRLSQKVALANGIDISHQRSRRFTAADLKQFDKIYAMAEDVLTEMQRIARKDFDATKVELLMNELYPGKNMDVPDPWYGTEPGYHEVYAMIDKACDKIIEKYRILNDERPMSK